MTPEDYAQLVDAMAQVVEVALGYRAKLEEAGFSPMAAEMMAVDFHRMMLAGVDKAAGSDDCPVPWPA